MNQHTRMTIPRGLIVGTLAAIALVWGLFAIDPGRSLVSSVVQTAVLVGLLVLTARSRRIKALLVRTVQRWTINPLMRLLLTIGINPLGLAILETRGRSSGKPRRVPVGNGRKGDAFWIIAEHGTRAEYVRNIQQDPRVRVGCGSACATAGCPASPPSCPTTTPWHANDASSAGTRYVPSMPSTCACLVPTCSRYTCG